MADRVSYGYDDIRLEPADNGGFVLRYCEYWKPANAKDSDNIQSDYGKMNVYTADQSAEALSAMMAMASKRRMR